MSDIDITIQTISEIDAHPGADRLEIAKILGTQCIVPKGEYKPHEQVFYFPPGMMIPESVADILGVKKYLKHTQWKDEKVQSRIAACRIRGVTSYGFVISLEPGWAAAIRMAHYLGKLEDGLVLTDVFGGEQYEPPALGINGLPGMKGRNEYALHEGSFHRYTSIQNYYRYPDVFEDDEQVVITEKIHGTNSRVGVLREEGEWVYAAGSHKVRWKDSKPASRYWQSLGQEGMLDMLADICNEKNNVIVFGEIFGSGVQDMDYGVEGDKGYRVFDISVNGNYVDWPSVVTMCFKYGLRTAPVIYEGPWICVKEVLDDYACGLTSVGAPTRKFKGREGVVIKPVRERLTDRIGGSQAGGRRTILKYISADYLDRKGAQDNA